MVEALGAIGDPAAGGALVERLRGRRVRAGPRRGGARAGRDRRPRRGPRAGAGRSPRHGADGRRRRARGGPGFEGDRAVTASRRGWDLLLPGGAGVLLRRPAVRTHQPAERSSTRTGITRWRCSANGCGPGALPHVDTFAFTHTIVPAVHHEWGAGAVLYLLATKLGQGGVMAARWLISSVVVAVAGRTARRRARAGRRVLLPRQRCCWRPSRSRRCGLASTRCCSWPWSSRPSIATGTSRARDASCCCGSRWPRSGSTCTAAGSWGSSRSRCTPVSRRRRRRPMLSVHLPLALAAVPVLMALTPYGRDYFAGWWHSITFPGRRRRVGAAGATAPTCWGWRRSASRSCCCSTRWFAVDPARVPGLPFVRRDCLGSLAARASRGPVRAGLVLCRPGLAGRDAAGRAAGRGRRGGAARVVVASAALAAGVGLVAVALPRHPFTLRVPAQGSDLGVAPVVYPGGAVRYLRENGFRGRVVTSFINRRLRHLEPASGGARELRRPVRGGVPAAGVRRGQDDSRRATGWPEILARYAADAVLVQRDEPLARACPAPRG